MFFYVLLCEIKFVCAMCCSLERIQQLISAGVDVNAVDSESTQNSPLHWAACYSNVEIISYLIGKLTRYSVSLQCHMKLTVLLHV